MPTEVRLLRLSGDVTNISLGGGGSTFAAAAAAAASNAINAASVAQTAGTEAIEAAAEAVSAKTATEAAASLAHDAEVAASLSASDAAGSAASASGSAAAAAALVGGAYESRAAFSAATVPAPVISWSIISNGRKFDYIRDDTGTACTSANGVKGSPAGDAYVDHWAANTTPGTTDMASAIAAGSDWCATAKMPLRFVAGDTYCIASQVRITRSNTVWNGDGEFGSRPVLLCSGNIDAIYAAPTVPNNSVGTIITNFSINNLIVQYNGTGSTGAGVRIARINGALFDNFSAYGFKFGILSECCWNVEYREISISALNFTGASGSATVKITGLLDDLGVYKFGYTHQFSCRRLGGGEVYDALIEIGANDFTSIDVKYFGFSKARIKLRPAHDDARIINTECFGIYLDGGPFPTTTTFNHLEIDGSLSAGTVEFTRIHGGVIGQCGTGIYIHDCAAPGLVECNGVDFHNSERHFINADATAGTDLVLKIRGGNMWYWNRNGDAGYAEAIKVGRAAMVDIEGVHFKPHTTAKPIASISNTTTMIASNNVATGVSSNITTSGVTNRVQKGNVSNILWLDEDTYRRGSWTPDVSFGGASTGITYTTRNARYFLHDRRIEVSIYIVLSSKGSAAGSFALSLPTDFPSASTTPNVLTVRADGLTASSVNGGIVGLIGTGATTMSLRRHLDTGGNETLDDGDFNNNTVLMITGSYEIA